MSTHETGCINLEVAPVPPGTAMAAAEAASPICTDLPGGAPSSVPLASIDNTLGRGRVRVTTGAGIAFMLRLTCAVDGFPQVINWALQPNQSVLGPQNDDGSPLNLTKIRKIETVTAGGAPVAPGAAVRLEWVRPGARIAANGAASVLGVYPGDSRTAAPPGRLMAIRDAGNCAARCSGGWAARDDLVVGAAGTLRKRAAMGDDAAQSVATASEIALDAVMGLVDLG